MIVLIGFMGSGKTTVARLLAARLGVPYEDSDRVVEARAGRSIAELFAERGEAGFRELERAAVRDTLSDRDAVVALGGGAIIDEETREVIRSHTVVLLDVSLETALERVGDQGSDRPLLRERDPALLFAERQELYRGAASVTIPTDGCSPHEIVDELVERLDLDTRGGDPRRVRVFTPPDPYDVVVGRGVAVTIHRYLGGLAASEKAFVITHPSLEEHASSVAEGLAKAGLDVETLAVPDGEPSKSLATAEELYRRLVGAAAHRDDVIVSIGGGVISDVGGFVASTYMRGLAHVVVPTTLLGQVDAAVGGKTGVNLDDLKNVVGTIYQPRLVLCDIDLLRTCPEAETRSGLAEVIKYGFISDPGILREVKARAPEIVSLDPELLVDLVARSVAVKASVVASDERERGDRAFLNYGHTFAHAIETVAGLGRLRHGEAVALGMMAAAYASEELGWIEPSLVDLHREVLGLAGLPVRAELDFDALSDAWTKDKKYRGGVRLVLLRGLGRPQAGVKVPETVLKEAIARLARED